MLSRWAEDPVAPDFAPSAETVVSSIAEDETIDTCIDMHSMEASSDFAITSRPPSDVLSGSADRRDGHADTSVAKEDLDETFDLSISNDGSDEEEGGRYCSDEEDCRYKSKHGPAHHDTPTTQASYASEPFPHTIFALDITEVLEDAQTRTDREYLERGGNDKAYRYCPVRIGGPRMPQIVLLMLALVVAMLGVVGAVVPNVPSMPFVLLAAACSFAFCFGSVSYLGRPVN